MSSPAPGTGGAGGGAGGGRDEKGQGLSKFMRRASKVLRRGSSSKGSLPPPIEEAPPSSPPPVPTVASPGPVSSSSVPRVVAPPPKSDTPASPSVPAALQQSIKDTKPTFKDTNHRLAKTAAASNAIQEEKARAVFVKYGFRLEPGEWTSPTSGDAERVEKIVRIRVRRTCHRCNISFGAEKVCISCQHTRCKKCPRYPSKGTKDRLAKGASTGPAVAVDENFKGTTASALGQLTILQRTTGQELIRRDPVQRTRRLCHRCDTPFDSQASECENCTHQRCPECPRDPPKLSKHPEGYPGDGERRYPLARREFKPILMHVRWTCHTCQTVFKDLETVCQGCDHERCAKCPREPPAEEEAGLDEAAVRKITEKMRNVNISPQAPAA